MKKFFILITLIGTSIFAIQDMEMNLSAAEQKEYDALKTFIHNADVESFKVALDALESGEKRSVMNLNLIKFGLEQVIVETKAVINQEIEALGDATKNWPTMIKGGLASLGVLIGGVSGVTGLVCALDRMFIIDLGTMFYSIVPFATPTLLPISAFDLCRGGGTHFPTAHKVIAATSVLYLAAAYKGLTYGPKTLMTGYNYKQYLQDQLSKLDVIAGYVAQPKEHIVEQDIPYAGHTIC